MAGSSHLTFSEFYEGKDGGFCFVVPVFINRLISAELISLHLGKVPLEQETKGFLKAVIYIYANIPYDLSYT